MRRGGASSAGTPCGGLTPAPAGQPVRDPPGVPHGARWPFTAYRIWWWASTQTTPTCVTQEVGKRARRSRALPGDSRSLGPPGKHVLGYRQSHMGRRTRLPSKHDTERSEPADPRVRGSRRGWPGPRAPHVPFGSPSVTPAAPRGGTSLRTQPPSALNAFGPKLKPLGPFQRRGVVLLGRTQVLLPAHSRGSRKTGRRAPRAPLRGMPAAERQRL